MRSPMRLLAVAAVLSLPAIRLAGSAEPPTALLIEDSFESGTEAPDGWSRGFAVPGVEYVYDRRNASDGKRSLGLPKTANRYFPIAAWSRLLKHDGGKPALQITAKVKAQKSAKAVIDAQFLGANGEPIKHEWVAYIGQENPKDPLVTHDWKTYGKAVEIPEGTTQIGIAFQLYGPGKVWFDELEARYVDEAGEVKKGAPRAKTGQGKVPPSKADIPPPIELRLKSGGVARYLLLPPKVGVPKPREGYPLLLVLPGGDGSAEFHPFVCSVHREALDGRFVIAQLLAPPSVVWPTSSSIGRLATTEEFIAATIQDVAQRQPIDREHVLALGWSSSGPAVYATLLDESLPLSGAILAMSVFKPQQLPPLTGAAKKRIYLLHSPTDKVCPFRMAKDAETQLSSAGAAVKLAEYAGGHGWHGPVSDQIRAGIAWLQQGQSP